MKESANYIKIVEWSHDDNAFIGRCPGVIGQCCHGPDELEVYRELCGIVNEWIELSLSEGRPLPPATVGNKLVEV